ncbi:MAG: hypothetical protein CMG57_08730 [Candidatus Marinimicrobia bacterium]|nr:hypothetical protein [Candidatus Neomarinimicrobiota bacterium]|tara:strand:+ start:4641 stop:5777 length:1137 start_codon:yes stop_codon:yes gene_type:complete
MKILLCDFFYSGLVQDYYSTIELEGKSYDEIKNGLVEYSYQWLPYFYIEGKKNNFNIDIVLSEDFLLQKKWSEENNLKFSKNWEESVLYQQIKIARPDIYFFAGNFKYYNNFFKKIKPFVGKIVCWISAEIPYNLNLNYVDLMISDNKKILEFANSKGINSVKMLSSVPLFNDSIKSYNNRANEIVFTGSLGRQFRKRNNILKYLIRNNIELQIFGMGLGEDSIITMPVELVVRRFVPNIYKYLYNNKLIPLVNSIKDNVQDPVFGKRMINVLNNTKMVLNVHSDFDIDYAINMRVFEALSMGCLLFTEKNKEVEKHFEDKKHLVIYSNENDLLEKINYFKKNKNLAKEICFNGQKEISKVHSTSSRFKEFINIIESI